MIDDAGAAPAAAESMTMDEKTRDDATPASAGNAETSTRSAIDRAFAEIEKREQSEASEKAAGPARDEPRENSGAGKAQSDMPGADKLPISEPPQRFSADAKAAWASVPDQVKGEVHRSFRELEGGLTRYRQLFEPLKPFYEMAETHETTIPKALARYTALDLQLASGEPKERLLAIEEVLAHAGMSPKDYAALVAKEASSDAQGEPGRGGEPAGDMGILRQELAGLKAEMGGVASTLRQSQRAELAQMVGDFARTHPRLQDRAFLDTVTRLISTRMADDLKGAYAMADRLIPVSVTGTRPDPASDAASARAAQTRKGDISVAGAPVSGSNPAKRKPAPTARESLDRAFAEMGF